MTDDADTQGAPARSALHRALGLRDLVLFYIACIVSLSSLAQVAQFGYASITLYALAVITFLIPSALVVVELSERMPEEGGFYVWTGRAFGEMHAFVAAWCYWLANIVWFPTVALLVAVSLLYVGGESLLPLADAPLYNVVVCLVILWGVTALNLIGMERAKWVQNVGGAASWATALLLLGVAGLHLTELGSAQPFSPDTLVPDLLDPGIFGYFAVVAFCFGGLELAPVMAGEIASPRRTVPRAILIASVSVGLIYVLGTLALIVTLPEGEIGIIEGVAQAFLAVERGLGIPGLGAAGGLLVALSTLGLFGAWLTGTARIPFVIGLAHYFPPAFGRIHPRYGSPWVSLLVQAVLVTLLTIMAAAGATVEEAFLVLLDMSIVLYFIPFLYIFAAFSVLMLGTPPGQGMFAAFRRGSWAVVLVGGAGFLTTLVSTIASVVPTRDIADPVLFLVKVIGGAALLIGIGLGIFLRQRSRQPPANRSGPVAG